jgi:hypothetical protein
MMKHLIYGSFILASSLIFFSGCAKSVECKAPDNSKIRVSVLEDSTDPLIVTYRWNPFVGGWFTGDVISDGDKAIANMSTPALFTIWGAQNIQLDGKNDKVILGEDSYKCNGDLSTLTLLIQKINRTKIDDRIRALQSDANSGRGWPIR